MRQCGHKIAVGPTPSQLIVNPTYDMASKLPHKWGPNYYKISMFTSHTCEDELASTFVPVDPPELAFNPTLELKDGPTAASVLPNPPKLVLAPVLEFDKELTSALTPRPTELPLDPTLEFDDDPASAFPPLDPRKLA
ncbi:hypothetical protein ACH5RR_006465 [Cinchona calisaya]|uniref:Uncharacterized protein n=1 Tax=Cinchona calisaya TaxID=153742 RepID=A0ABD3AP44_9GENT